MLELTGFSSIGLGAMLCACAAAAALAQGTQGAQQTQGAQGESSTRMASSPMFTNSAAFVVQAWMDNTAEVNLGKLAQKNSKSQDVRTFGSRMVKDHGAALAELTSIANNKNLPVPKDLDKERMAAIEELTAKTGADFDSAYAARMVEAHNDAIALFKKYANSRDVMPEIAQYSQKYLPTLEQHRKMAEELASKHASSSGR